MCCLKISPLSIVRCLKMMKVPSHHRLEPCFCRSFAFSSFQVCLCSDWIQRGISIVCVIKLPVAKVHIYNREISIDNNCYGKKREPYHYLIEDMPRFNKTSFLAEFSFQPSCCNIDKAEKAIQGNSRTGTRPVGAWQGFPSCGANGGSGRWC